MKTLLVLFLFVLDISSAQDLRADDRPAGEAKRLSSVTWDLKSHKLVWVVQTGTLVNGEFKTASSETYEISPEKAVMAVADERRGFTPQEAAVLQRLLDTLSLYCAESVIWWDNGEGFKLDRKNEKEKDAKREIVSVPRTSSQRSAISDHRSPLQVEADR